MFRNLEAEMARANISRGELAKRIGVTPTTLSMKLNGKSPITLREAFQIKGVLSIDMGIDTLFFDSTDERETLAN